MFFLLMNKLEDEMKKNFFFVCVFVAGLFVFCFFFFLFFFVFCFLFFAILFDQDQRMVHPFLILSKSGENFFFFTPFSI